MAVHSTCQVLPSSCFTIVVADDGCSMRLTLHLLIVQGFLYVKARGDNCAAEQSGAP